VDLHGHLTLREVEAQMKSNRTAKESVEFFSPDGTRYSKSAKVMEIMRLPFFRLRLDHWNEYHVHSKRAFKQSLSFVSPGEKDFIVNSVQKFNISELKARTNAKLYHNVIDRLERANPDAVYSHEDVSMMLRDAIAKQCLSVNS